MSSFLKMIPARFLLVYLLAAAFLHMGTIRKKETAVSKAQTSGIKLKDKLEELKDGEKGPATPTYGWYGGNNGFMGDPPFVEPNTEPVRESPPEVTEVDWGDTGGTETGERDEFGWSEDWLGTAQKNDEALPSEADTLEDVPETVETPETDTSEDTDASKWDKDWWDEI